MKDQLEKRLTELKSELESARKILADLKVRQAGIKNTILRMEGAIDVLEDELKKARGNEEKKKEEIRKPALKKNTGQPVTSAPGPAAAITGGETPGHYSDVPAGKPQDAQGLERNAVILKAIRRNAPQDRKFTQDEIDELFTGMYGRDEINESLDILIRDGMITRNKNGIQVL